MRVSTFELLLKPITPATPDNPKTPEENALAQTDRLVLQGYFLTIANTSETDLGLRLQFTATIPDPSTVVGKTFVFLDFGEEENTDREELKGNLVGDLSQIGDSNKFEFKFTLPGSKTALFLVQPDILPPPTSSNDQLERIEIRGFAEIFLESPPSQEFELLLTPEHRGTFLPAITSKNMDKMQGLKKLIPDFDQLVYPLPTPNGGSLFVLGPTLPGPMDSE
jgi:hypothetical protein